MLKPPRQTPPPDVKRLSVKSWEAGTITAYDDRRTPLKGLRDSQNMILTENAVLRPAPGLVKYGPQLLGKPMGELFEFKVVKPTGVENWLCNMQLIDGVGKIVVAKGSSPAWTVVSGKTYSVNGSARFVQLKNKVLIMTGEDHLSILNIDETPMTITAFTSLDNPSAAPVLETNTGLTGTSFKVFAAVTANSEIGVTAGSPVLAQQVSAPRDTWNPDTQKLKFKWTAVAGAKSYNFYIGVGSDGSGEPTLYQVAAGIPKDTLFFEDNGTLALDLLSPLPRDNSTAGPKTSRGSVIAGRAWLVGDKDDPYKIWRGGTLEHMLDFSPSNGGGYSVVGYGTKEIPVAVKPYRDGKGDARVTVLSQGTNGGGKRFYLSSSTITHESTTFTIWDVTEDSGNDGTDAPDSVVIYNNDLHYLSRDGFKSTGTLPSVQSILSTKRISNSIQDSINSLNSNHLKNTVGLAYEGRIYWAVSVGTDYNNQIWVYDSGLGGAWMKPWSVQADWMTLYNDENGKSHHLIVNETGIYEFSYKALTTDGDNEPMQTSITSGQITFDKTGREWARVLKVLFVIMRPQGRMSFTLIGRTEDGLESFTEIKNFTGDMTPAGWGELAWSEAGWGEIGNIPEVTTEATVEVAIEPEEDMKWAQYAIRTTEKGVDYSLSDVILEYVPIGAIDND